MNKSIKICHISSVHKDGDIRIFHKECVTLSEAGFEVVMLITNTTERTEKGVAIKSVEKPVGARIKRMIFTVNKIYKKALEIDADVYHLHDPELLRIALKLKRKGKKVIYDAHEDLPRQVLSKPYLSKTLLKIISFFIEKYENRIASKLDYIIVSTPTIKKRFININGLSEAICNYPILGENIIVPDWKSRKNEICYVGGITRIRGIVELVQSLKHTNNVKLNIAGAYSPLSLKEELHSLDEWDKVQDFGFVGRQEIVNILNNSRVGIVTLYPQINYLDSLPIKLFEYMLAGLPVIGSHFPLWKEIIEGNNCGICVDPQNPKAIAEAIQTLLNDSKKAQKMGENGRKAVLEKYNWESEANKLVTIYRSLNK